MINFLLNLGCNVSGYLSIQNEMACFPNVTYWPSTEPSIKRCTCVNKWKKAKQVNPVEDIGISPWPVDVVEFGADAYAHRKQVDVNQLYNQVPQTAWCSESVQSSWRQFQSQLEIRWPRSENQLLTEGLGPQWPTVEQPSRMRKKCCYGQKNLGQYVAVCPRLQLTSHTQPTSTLSRIKCERYIFIKKCVRSFIEVSH